jgi:hypothetical protein
MVSKIVSGGQTGADRAALDVALELGIAHGGWVPQGRRAEDGVIPEKYVLTEMPSESYAERTEQNVIDSDGTLILSHGALTEGSELTAQLAASHGRPWLHIDLEKTGAFQAALNIRAWAAYAKIEVLNVAGPRASNDPQIYAKTARILKAAFLLETVTGNLPDPSRVTPHLPQTVPEAVDRLISELSLRDRAKIAAMEEATLSVLEDSLGAYIRDKFELGKANRELLVSIRSEAEGGQRRDDEAWRFILKALWQRLRLSHKIRRVK